mgnify:CR=1 FL=1
MAKTNYSYEKYQKELAKKKKKEEKRLQKANAKTNQSNDLESTPANPDDSSTTDDA